MRKILILLFASVLTFSCGTSKSMNALSHYEPTKEKVEILGPGQTIPENAVLIGNVSVRDTGFTSAKNCTYVKVIQEASEMAQQMGGNIVYIVSHKEPGDESTCHRINVNVYRMKID